MADETLGEALPKEIARVRELLCEYKRLGPVGIFGATMIEQDLKEADEAMITGDIVAMVRVYKKLKDTQ